MKAMLVGLMAAGLAYGQAGLRMSVYVTAGDAERHLSTEQGRLKALGKLKALEVTRVFLEGRRGDEYVGPEKLGELRKWFEGHGIESTGGIATVPGKRFGKRQVGGYGWLDWEDEATQSGVAGFFKENAPVFDELIIDDFYCTGDETERSAKARGARSWGRYRQDLLVGLIDPMIVRPARGANARVKLIMKFPQWYDMFETYGYDPARMGEKFETLWAGTEVRNPETQRMGYAMPTLGYNNYLWIDSVTGGKLRGAWFDHIETTPQNFVDQAQQSVLAGAKELTLFLLTNLMEGDPGDALLKEKLPALKALHGQVAGRARAGIAYYKPVGVESGENRFLMDYLGILGVPVLPVSRYPVGARAVVLGLQASKEPGLAEKARGHKAVFATTALLAARPELKGLKNVRELKMRTFSDADYVAAKELLLPPAKLPYWDMTQSEAEALRAPLVASIGVRFSAPARVSLALFEGAACVTNFRAEPIEAVLDGKKIAVEKNGWVWVKR